MAPAVTPEHNGRWLAAGVGALAVVVYLGALANGFAWDDVPVIADNALVHQLSGLWRAFTAPYWPPGRGADPMYRPLVVATFALDWLVAPGRAWWLHGVNLVWHAGASAALGLLARRWAGDAAGWIAGALFAVHPVHVEAVANMVGRTELAAGLFSLLAVWLAVERDNLPGSALAWACGLLSKENAAVVPALIGAAWLLGFRRPPARRIATYAGVWCAMGLAYAVVREAVFQPHPASGGMAIVFLGQSPLTVRLTAVAALADVARLLVFPLRLRADYSPNERTAVTGLADPRFLAGLACLTLWAMLAWLLWRRQRRVEALGITWIGVALAPVANLLFPAGVLVAERTLYLPSAGLALAAGAWIAAWRAGAGARARRIADGAVALVVAAGGVRTALRVPVWDSTATVYQSVVRDSPRSYFGPVRAAIYEESEGRLADALQAYRRAASILPSDTRLPLRAAEMAYRLDLRALADTLLGRIDSTCVHCETFFQAAAMEARSRGQTGFADALLAHLEALKAARHP